MSDALRDKVYIVTGGSKGFGQAIARALVAGGARVGLVSRGQEGLDAAVQAIGTEHALGVAADVSSREALQNAFTEIHDHFGRFDGLVNNAGLAMPNAVETLVEEEVVAQVNTNFLGTVFACQVAIPMLRTAENPRIINISSASAWHYDEMCHLSIYASTKAAVERFTRDLRMELQVDGIGVTCVRPGGAATSFADGWDGDALAAGFNAWRDLGTYMDLGMDVDHVGASVAYALSQPPGVAVDLLEIRPNMRCEKPAL